MRKTVCSVGAMILIAALASGSCSRRPKGILSEKEMTEVLTDIQMAGAYYSTTPAGNQRPDKEDLMKSVLDKHGISQAEMDSTIAYYGRNMDEYYMLYEKVEKNLRARNGQSETAVQENDIWPYERFAAFMPGQSMNGIIFSISADELEPGNTLEWRMRLNSSVYPEMTLGVEYEEGVSSIVKKNGAGGNAIKLSLITDTALTAKRIFGTMEIPQSALPLWADSIRLVKLDFDSIEYNKIRTQKRISKPAPKPKRAEIVDSLHSTGKESVEEM